MKIFIFLLWVASSNFAFGWWVFRFQENIQPNVCTYFEDCLRGLSNLPTEHRLLEQIDALYLNDNKKIVINVGVPTGFNGRKRLLVINDCSLVILKYAALVI